MNSLAEIIETDGGTDGYLYDAEGIAQDIDACYQKLVAEEEAAEPPDVPRQTSHGTLIFASRGSAMITGADLLQISLARVNMDRSDFEAAGVIDAGQAGDKAWTNFGRDVGTFILKLPEWRRAALAALIRERSGRRDETPH
ncbi:hypothetical protein LPJGGPFB_04867 [Ensifer adhaerens]|uniref:hypothetical protein n=1 Tax=Ensifer adhaerens TaxID=106592 RepID=UPI001568A929|nr:hypothetical protein [Ensifer adhaerens]NRP21608.1 hypothetical protein [Ensifer adhaerens]